MENKRLYRSSREQMIAGVCAGLAEYFAIDPTLVRLIFVILALMGGPGILIYIVLWIVMPEGPTAVGEVSPTVAPEAKVEPSEIED